MSYIQKVVAILPPGLTIVPTGTTAGGSTSQLQSEINALNAELQVAQAEIQAMQAELALQPEYFLRAGLAVAALYAEEVRAASLVSLRMKQKLCKLLQLETMSLSLVSPTW